MKYIMLDKDDITEVCGVIDEKDLIQEIGEQGLWRVLYVDNVFYKDMFILVEDEIKKKFYETKEREYFATNEGWIYSLTKKNKVRKTLVGFRKKGVRTIKFGNKTIAAKNLIAHLFYEDYKEGDIVLQKDGSYYNVSLENLVVVPKERYSIVTGALSKSQAVGLYEDEKLVKKWSSARKCAKDMYCSYQTIMDYCNKKVKKPMFDVRWI